MMTTGTIKSFFQKIILTNVQKVFCPLSSFLGFDFRCGVRQQRRRKKAMADIYLHQRFCSDGSTTFGQATFCQKLSNVWSWLARITETCLGVMPECFCGRLKIPSARWVWSTFSSDCPLSSKQCNWLTSTSLTFFSSEIFSGTIGNPLRAAGSGSKFANHCAVPLKWHHLVQRNWYCSHFLAELS